MRTVWHARDERERGADADEAQGEDLRRPHAGPDGVLPAETAGQIRVELRIFHRDCCRGGAGELIGGLRTLR